MSIVPRIKLYASDGISLQYTFELVQETNIPEDANSKSILHKNPRSKGGVIVDGGNDVQEIFIRGILSASDYEALIVKMDVMKSAIVKNTAYVLKMDKTVSTTYSINVKRIERIAITQEGSQKWTTHSAYEVRFLGNVW